MNEKHIRWNIFLPPWLIFFAVFVLNLIDFETFTRVVNAVCDWILATFSWLFNLTTLFTLIIVVATYFSPLKNVRFGGSQARPILSYSSYTWIVLCTIMGSGLMLWACAEPMYHLHFPPANITEGALSGESVQWAMETIFLEWTFSPMALYTLPALLFAFVFYNMKKSFSIGSMLSPLLNDLGVSDRTIERKVTPIVDCICLFCLCAGMTAALGVGVLLIGSGIEYISGGRFSAGPATWIAGSSLVILVFIIAAISGVKKGINLLSKYNTYFYLVLGIFVFLCGPTVYILSLGFEGFGALLSDYFSLSLNSSAAFGDGWAERWPVFYWCTWLAWTAISAAFLGRISKGYTVKEALNVIFLIPSLFSVIWLAIFSGSTVHFELTGGEIFPAMESGGTSAAAYALLEQLPGSVIVIPLFLLTAVLSYITSASANISAIAGLCTTGLSEQDSESSPALQVVWGLTIGAVCVIMLIAFDIEGVKKLAYIGGLPIVFLMLLFIVCFIKIMKNPQKYDIHKEDYFENGYPNESERLPYEGFDPDKKTFLQKWKMRNQ
ncbi:MAG TPA: BCCT family transporter [Clostridiales bacterium]|nr:BCCT family transporter [Clostridiales bacterium]